LRRSGLGLPILSDVNTALFTQPLYAPVLSRAIGDKPVQTRDSPRAAGGGRPDDVHFVRAGAVRNAWRA
jgi:hypothetical protein